MRLKALNIAFLSLTAAFTACSDIAESERLIYVAPAEAKRNVLIEDFTGQNCVNCPSATEAIHEMQEVYGENIIPVAIHCGNFGVKNNGTSNAGLMMAEGQEYWDAWFTSQQGQPVAKINRGEATSDYGNWSADVAKAMEKTTDVNLGVMAGYDKDGHKLDISVAALGKAGKMAKLQVWLTEDKIISRQQMPDGSRNREYEHNHVFRAAVNGTWGEDITFGEDQLTLTYEAKLAEYWVAENMNVVVFVYDDNEVLQAVQVKMGS